MPWFYANGGWSLVSILFLTWWTKNEIGNGFKTQRSEIISYVIEIGFILLAGWATVLLSAVTYPEECRTETGYKG